MIKKNEKYIVNIIDQGIEGQGIAKIDGFAVFINGAIKGEKISIVITKVLSSYAYGRILEVIEQSEFRRESDCETYKRCGGCSLRHIDYKKTLEIKTEMVKNCLQKELNYLPNVHECIGMENPLYYRNKLQYPVGESSTGELIMGIYANRSHEIIETKECLIQDKESQQIANELFEIMKKNNIRPYNESKKTGNVRHIIIRKGKKTNEIMVTIVTKMNTLENDKQIVEELVNKFKNIKTIVQNINNKDTNVILGEKNKILYGSGYIEDYLGNFKFKISPVSFYQVNPTQTEVLYNKAIECAELTENETAFDLYCGIGTIGIFASNKVKKIIGIEVVPEAIENAKENAENNNVKNSLFLVGEVEKLLPELVEKEEADIVFIDPPRKGCDRLVLDTLLKVEPKKIIYISCNPATLARDVKILKEKYELIEVQPVDMFPYTSHVESISTLKLKK